MASVGFRSGFVNVRGALFPRAHNSFRSRRKKVKVEVARDRRVAHYTPTPMIILSPPCTALVLRARKRLFLRGVVEEVLARSEIVGFIVCHFGARSPRQAPIWAEISQRTGRFWRGRATPGGRRIWRSAVRKNARCCRANARKALSENECGAVSYSYRRRVGSASAKSKVL